VKQDYLAMLVVTGPGVTLASVQELLEDHGVIDCLRWAKVKYALNLHTSECEFRRFAVHTVTLTFRHNDAIFNDNWWNLKESIQARSDMDYTDIYINLPLQDGRMQCETSQSDRTCMWKETH